MPLQNRVLPDQTIAVLPARGTLTGNRGILHDATKTLRRRWTSKAWICCSLDWKGTRRSPMSSRSWTELFFLDEATALAAGHRPCATCRSAAYQSFRHAWIQAALPGTKAAEIDAHLHAQRLTPQRIQRLHLAQGESLPDATFILLPRPPDPAPPQHPTPPDHPAPPHQLTSPNPGLTPPPLPCPHPQRGPHILLGPNAFPYTPQGYLSPLPRPTGPVQVMTPEPTVAVLRAGYRPSLHPSLPLHPGANIPREGLGGCETLPAGSAERPWTGWERV